MRQIIAGIATLLAALGGYTATADAAPVNQVGTSVAVVNTGFNKNYSITFDNLERQYIAAGKAKHVAAQIDNLASVASKQLSKRITLDNLIDNNPSNGQIVSIEIDESDPFNEKITGTIQMPNGRMTVSYSPRFASGNGAFFVPSEIEQMRENIKEGKSKEMKYSRISNKKELLVRELDAQAGKIPGAKAEWRPRFEYQMGFGSEGEMRNLLASTKSISIQYVPHDKWSVGTGTDFKVSYNLADGRSVVKFVKNFPLDESLK